MELDETELAHRVPQSQSASPRLCRKTVGRMGGDVPGSCVSRHCTECGLDGAAMPGVAMTVVR